MALITSGFGTMRFRASNGPNHLGLYALQDGVVTKLATAGSDIGMAAMSATVFVGIGEGITGNCFPTDSNAMVRPQSPRIVVKWTEPSRMALITSGLWLDRLRGGARADRPAQHRADGLAGAAHTTTRLQINASASYPPS